MKAINCIFRETIKEGEFEMKSHILVFLDDNGTEQSAPFTEVRFDGHFDSYQLEGGIIQLHARPYGSYFLK